MNKYNMIADFGSFTVEERTTDYSLTLSDYKREERKKKRKEELESKIACAAIALIPMLICVLMLVYWIAFGY